MDDDNKKWDSADPSRTPMTYGLLKRRRIDSDVDPDGTGCLVAVVACIGFIGAVWLLIVLCVSPLLAVLIAFLGTLAVSLGVIALSKRASKRRRQKKGMESEGEGAD